VSVLPSMRYREPKAPADSPALALIVGHGTADERRFVFYDQIEIGRDDGRPEAPGVVLVADPTISRRHCVVVHRTDGRCYVRDVSRNGTRLDGRRLVPNIEAELRPGQAVSVSSDLDFVLEGGLPLAEGPDEPSATGTIAMPASAFATLLVGDIRDYTVLVRRAPSQVLQSSVNRVFDVLSRAVGELGGTIKEYQGDALVAFWEGRAHGSQVAAACHAALELDRIARDVAIDRSVWQVDDFPLQMDFALATGPVMIDSIGGSRPTGLSMIGEPIVLAFRLEKFANDQLGRILTCRVTKQMAGQRFKFRDLGEMKAKGFDRPDRVYALEEERQPSTEPTSEVDAQ